MIDPNGVHQYVHVMNGELTIQVFGQMELVERLKSNRDHCSHLISVGNPRHPLRRAKPEEQLPEVFLKGFNRILRLEFFDAEKKEQLRWWSFPKIIPNRLHVQQVISFYQETRNEATRLHYPLLARNLAAAPRLPWAYCT